MAVIFTPEQQRVIDLQGSSILVSAAAGSGKTAVLAERIVKKVCDGLNPVDIDRLLIVTFTNAAAAEMRERIAAGIAARLARNPESEHIQRQATLLHNAQITTIDSFCLFLLKNHFNEIGLDPAFRIADEGEIRLMREETLGELIEDAYASGEESFRRCVEYFCPGGRESVLEQHILELSRYADSFPWPSEWLEERKRDYDLEDEQALETSACGRYLTGHLQAMARGWVRRMKRIQGICQEPDGPYMYGETVDNELEQLERLERCGSLAEYAAYLPAISFGRLSSRKDESVSPGKRELAGNLRAELKKSVKGAAEGLFTTPLSLAVEQGLECREPVATLIDLVSEFQRRMAEKKREKKVIDFSDMEHFALEILLAREEGEARPGRVALEYRQYFEEVLIDEYQDSNLVQEYLLSAISGEEEGRFNRFMVGDVKQSIYKFRLARPELFLEKYNTYAQEGGSRVRIDLSRNFRSRGQVIEAVNQVFSRLMSRETGGIEYDDRAALYPGAVYPENEGNESELLLIEKPSREAGLTEKQAEAAAIAKRIRELRESFSVTDRESGELRPLRYSDIVILLRTNSGWDDVFQEVLEKEGIPVYITSRTGYFGASEVQELLQLLRVLDNPRQDIPLFGVMKSIFGGFTDEEIALIRSGGRDCTLYEAAVKFAAEARSEEGEEKSELHRKDHEAGAGEGRLPADSLAPLRRKTARFLDQIARYRRCTVYLPVRELLTKLVTDFDYLNYVTALPAGGKRRANVEMLFTRASDFEKTSYFGLFHFVRYMEQLEKYDVDYGEAELLDENADVVRIMSIHKSKGLEFPVTFVSGLSKRFNFQDANRSLILDVDLGLATDYVNPERRLRNKTLRRNILTRKLREDSLSEELRVLYVAMTRAREKLILTAALEQAEEKWEAARENGGEALDYPDFMGSSSYMDFLLPVIGGTSFRVRVLGEEELSAADWREQLALHDRRQLLEQAAGMEGSPALEQLRRRLHREYAYEDLAGLYTKTTVSELKIAAMADRDEAAFHAFEEKEVQPYIPAFRREEEKVSGTVRGNAYHRVMELMDFPFLLEGAEEGLPERLGRFLTRETAEKRLKQEYADAVNQGKLLQFLRSDLARRMLRAAEAGKLYREQPFVMGISASRLGEQFPAEENVLIQGIIDVFFEEEDGLVLLDYKTDAVSSMQELWNRYETQLDYYSEALTKLMGRPVKEKILYSFRLGEY
ncbi:MAG: helicase-exonuclease AddAB subunit AddA [Roseburia sp.]|nr:helicase-exonuclease AddAB subunit AddA [Roseburia sp.]MCM1096763.1 helicase-exonuclease AddAB subunit AddA [Ruminococcus flavefaciens]